MPVVTIDGKKIETAEGQTVLKAALENGIYIPHFCYHPALSVSGNCRICVVEVEGNPKLEVSCNLQVRDGMVVRTDTEAVQKTRRDVLEFLLINHPVDCPICDKAGECYLQDYHFKYSAAPSRFEEEKVKKPKVVDIGPNIVLDDERCILCSRCVRFCHEVSKSSDLTIAKRGDRSYITTAPGRKLDNPYSMNTVDLCPVGSLTSKDFRFKKRVWYLKSTPSVCPGCSNGCRISVDSEGGKVYRFRPLSAVSKDEYLKTGFICDAGRLSYKEWQKPTRILNPLIKSEEGFSKISVMDALQIMQNAKGEFVGLMSAQLSVEDSDSFTGYIRSLSGKVFRVGRSGNFSEDNILVKKDKNPNTKYLKDLGIERLPPDVSGEILIITDTLSEDDVMRIVNFKWKLIIQITSDENLIVPGVDLVLPRKTFLEDSGTFVNYAGVPQHFEKAFDAKGDAKSIKEWVGLFGNK